ncbi:hypothetical protein ACS5PU_02115 [Pedobacter sp. GSP4]|uniref:hypothetical protein n=1 Tax=Pedobacter sp. GSP4 TaxID=3453716 RepID=UPI003EEB12C4
MEESNDILRQKRLSFRNRYIETCVWVMIAFIIFLPEIIMLFQYRFMDAEIFTLVYNKFLISLFVGIFPILFKLIFGKLPIEALRDRNKNTGKSATHVSGENIVVNVVNNSDTVAGDRSDTDEDYPMFCINQSSTLCERIFTRSGVYLLLGCLIAFIGIGIFYSPLFPVVKSSDLTQRLLDYLPRVSALLFIEFIAFFFLKQYKTMMDEYRYYEAIKRKRQDNYNLISFIIKHSAQPELIKLVTENMQQSYITKLANGETTEILESQKLTNQEFDFIGKLTALAKELKSSEK